MRKLLIDFGNYLLSTERKELISTMNRHKVCHTDIENFLNKYPEHNSLSADVGFSELKTFEPKKKSFEYHILNSPNLYMAPLDKLGLQGWELVLNVGTEFVFKREMFD